MQKPRLVSWVRYLSNIRCISFRLHESNVYVHIFFQASYDFAFLSNVVHSSFVWKRMSMYVQSSVVHRVALEAIYNFPTGVLRSPNQ